MEEERISTIFCRSCGAEINDKAVVCVKCGIAIKSEIAPTTGNNEWVTAMLLCLFLGWLGVHRFYTKNTDIAIAQLVLGILSCGVVSEIWAFVDFILILSGSYRKGNGQILTQ